MTAPRLVTAYARKYEPQHLIDELRENLAWVDAFVELDQRNRTDELWSRRDERVAELRRLAVGAHADWVLIMDPDERFEVSAEETIRPLLFGPAGTRYTFPFMELWTPDAYRVDGVWGHKTRRRLFHATHPLVRRTLVPEVNIYHLKMIEPANRALRARVHTQANTWDNPGLGFGYLDEDEGTVLEQIPPGRGYTPSYRPYEFTVPEGLLT